MASQPAQQTSAEAFSKAPPRPRAPTEKPEVLDNADMVCEDNLKYMRRFKDDVMNLIVTSPPYNLGKSYEQQSSLDAYLVVPEVFITS